MQEIGYDVKNEITSLIIERDILTKSIYRLYQQDSNLSKIKQDRLLTRYQHQLGIILAKIEKLGEARRHTASPLKDELIKVIDQKFSKLDKRLQELSSKISPQNKVQRSKQKIRKLANESSNLYTKTIARKNSKNLQTHDLDTLSQNPLEITTLTEIVPNNVPEFFLSRIKSSQPKVDRHESKNHEQTVKIPENVTKNIQPNICEQPNCGNPKFTNRHCSVHSYSNRKKTNENENYTVPLNFETDVSNKSEFKHSVLEENPVELTKQTSLPQTEETVKDKTKLIDNDKFEEDEDDIKKIKDEIEKSLSNLDQVEVE
jgi:hypothetical protein